MKKGDILRKMEYRELKEPCKSLIEKEICLGCNQLADYKFIANPSCKYVTNVEGKQIKLNLDGGKRWTNTEIKK